MKAFLHEDMVTGTGVGDIDGEPVPADLVNLPPERLRWTGTQLVDAATYSTFWIDAAGHKHIVAADGRQNLACAWNAPLANENGVWRTLNGSEILAPKIKAECGRRIVAVASKNAQMNMTAAAASGRLGGGDASTFASALEWVDAMRARCAELIVAQDTNFAVDAKWPPVPAGVADLVARY